MGAIRVYSIYASGAAAQAAAQIQIVGSGEILGVNFTGYAAVGNGSQCEISQQAARQFGTNNVQGLIAVSTLSNAATGPEQLHSNHFVPIPSGYKVKNGELIYMHTTQAGAGGSVQWLAQVYVRES